MAVDEAEGRQIRKAQRVGRPDQEKERVDGERAGPAELNENRPAEQQRPDDDPDRDQRGEPRPEVQV
jgi:hypothetical protein